MKRIAAAGLVGLFTVAAWGQSPNASPRAIEAANGYFRGNGRALGLTAADEVRMRSARTDRAGIAHIRYDQFYKGVKVFEGEAIAHVTPSGEVTLTNSLRGNLNLDVTPSISQAAAQGIAVRQLGIQGPVQVLYSELEILPRGERSPVDVLTWHFRIFVENSQQPTAQWDVFVNARNGNVEFYFDSLETATAIGSTMYSGDVTLSVAQVNATTTALQDPDRANNATYDLNHATKGTGTLVTSTDGDYGNNQRDLSDRQTAAADAHFGMMQTWDYFLTQHGRNGIDGAGRTTYSRVHYGTNYVNAFWSGSCFCMTFGDGNGSSYLPLVSLDIAGHEMAHGVTASEANLTYSGESGGLNEATSDIFGTMVEYYANNPVDQPDYWVGEMIYGANWSGNVFTPNTALRYMNDPARDGRSPACWSKKLRGMDVHYSSGPANHMFYLLAEGGVSKCNGKTVTGIGRARAAAIWYYALANLMTSSTNYAGARAAAINAASVIDPAAVQSVKDAFAAINVN